MDKPGVPGAFEVADTVPIVIVVPPTATLVAAQGDTGATVQVVIFVQIVPFVEYQREMPTASALAAGATAMTTTASAKRPIKRAFIGFKSPSVSDCQAWRRRRGADDAQPQQVHLLCQSSKRLCPTKHRRFTGFRAHSGRRILQNSAQSVRYLPKSKESPKMGTR